METKRKKRILISKEDVWLSAAASFLLFLYAPTMLYIQNTMDFSFSIFDVWRMMLSIALAMFFLSLAVLTLIRFTSNRLHTVCQTIYLASLVALFIQGTFLTEGIPILDGSSSELYFHGVWAPIA